MVSQMQWIVQASSKSWSGGRDSCMNWVRGKPVLWRTLEKIFEYFPSSKVVIAAPDFDQDGDLPQSLLDFPHPVALFFGNSASPLDRLVDACEQHFAGDGFIRIDALNMFFQPDDILNLWDMSARGQWDLIKFPDDYPIQFTADFYKPSALRRLTGLLPTDSPFRVHPKYALIAEKSFGTAYYTPAKMPCDETLTAARLDACDIYAEPRDLILGTRIKYGDSLGFHYELALPYIQTGDYVLDIACGGGYGTKVLAGKARSVIGADIDGECIAKAKEGYQAENLSYVTEDVTRTSFENASFDAITSFETIEHVDESAYIAEIYRLLKPGGMLLLSTPQNSCGHIPVNPQHRLEYALPQLRQALGEHFHELSVIGIKQGCIFFEGDPTGTNTFMALKKK